MKKVSLREQNRQNIIEMEKECQRKQAILDRLEQRAKARDSIKQEKRRIHNMIVYAGNVAQFFRNQYGYKFFDGTENDINEMEQSFKLIEKMDQAYKLLEKMSSREIKDSQNY